MAKFHVRLQVKAEDWLEIVCVENDCVFAKCGCFDVAESSRLLLGTEEGIYIAELAKDGRCRFCLLHCFLYSF